MSDEPLEQSEKERALEEARNVPAPLDTNLKYCPAGKKLCDHVRRRGMTIEVNSRVCQVSSFVSADPQNVDKWECCPVDRLWSYAPEPFEEAFAEFHSQVKGSTSMDVAMAAFKTVMGKYFVPKNEVL